MYNLVWVSVNQIDTVYFDVFTFLFQNVCFFKLRCMLFVTTIYHLHKNKNTYFFFSSHINFDYVYRMTTEIKLKMYTPNAVELLWFLSFALKWVVQVINQLIIINSIYV